MSLNKFAVVLAFAAIAVLASGVALAVAGALPSLETPEKPAVPVAPEQSAGPVARERAAALVAPEQSAGPVAREKLTESVAPEKPIVLVAPQQSADPLPKPTATPYVKQEESPSISIGGLSDSRVDEKIVGKEESRPETKDSVDTNVAAAPTPSLAELRGAAGQGSGGTSGAENGEGTVYTWQDGDREMRSVLQNDASDPKDDNVEGGNGGVTVKGVQSSGKDSGDVDDKVLPEFRMESGGGLMTLPGGVILLLDPEWDEAAVTNFFTSNNISTDDVKELGFVDNGFLVNTEAGFPSLNLANELTGKLGVISASPNWSRERQAK